MAGILKKFFHEKPSSPVNHEDFTGEYSFAIEYKGPGINYEIPRAVPINVDYIPTASVVLSSSQFSDDLSSLPVIQPIVKKLKRGSSSSPNSVISSTSEIQEDGGVCLHANKEDKCNINSCDGVESSSELENFNELKGRRGGVESLEIKNEEDFQGYSNSSDSESVESGLSSSSGIFAVREEEEADNETQPRHGRRPSAVTFLDPQTSNTISEEAESSQFEGESIQEMPRAERKGKKGSCYFCLKGNRFTEKEVCIVCGAKYCFDCIIRAMGTMPEGRKCISCIGFRIDESRRENLGKSSKVLKKLLTDSEIKSIMLHEKECEINQLPARLIYVNGDPLSRQELLMLRSCRKPPKNLKPGQYWYDKESGFWGKEGHGPSQIVSSQLEVGGRIKRNASNGNTNVCINNREITKKELRILKLAGVPCEGRPSFWVSADGSYQEEGMNNGGKIWDKTRTKLACALYSLPIPSNSVRTGEEIEDGAKSVSSEQKVLHKLLLVGHKKSGTSTIFKQAKQIYKVPFSDDERQMIKFLIQRNLYWYLSILLEGRERFEEEILMDEKSKQPVNDPSSSSAAVVTGNENQLERKDIYSLGPKLKGFADWLLQVVVSGNFETIFPAATRVYGQLVEELLKDEAFQATYSRRNELEMLPRVATYFLDRAIDISSIEYDPSDNDILYAEGITLCNSLSSMEFMFPESRQDSLLDPPYQHDLSIRYQLIRVHSSTLGENCKLLEMFDDIKIILFCVDLTDYDEFDEDDNGVLTNRMIASKQLFASIVTHQASRGKNFLLILNKFDLFEEKIIQVPLAQCEWFVDFNPMITGRSSSSTNPTLAQRAFQYIAVKFKRLFCSLTDKKLFVSQTTGMEPENVNAALRYAREIIKWQVDKPNISITEVSCTSVDASSFT
ncbi:extra-large guanine nucleotide-binding protein 1-like isoform X1 [Cucumis melo]|uniref:Extra-large guanine nucleotide-binding protein 1-like isoform X1 n=1 Tax=Cucumis melo TaxID=3656 RepID=A0A1S3C981_CUCME|nr:extra-large guanine nucleotide-binding protein 1-like isoform X1 [Cucumis melo]XP_050935352.1 extra-large guanine nucleotide-binding protein 1-like isoform X1 [Cucumis melo]